MITAILSRTNNNICNILTLSNKYCNFSTLNNKYCTLFLSFCLQRLRVSCIEVCITKYLLICLIYFFLEEEDFSDSVSTSNSFNFCVKIKTCSCEVEFLYLSLFDEQSSSMYFVFFYFRIFFLQLCNLPFEAFNFFGKSCIFFVTLLGLYISHHWSI